ncbi:TPA: DUF637 domain-containing protein [Vibrio alginolyticus]|nr:DUF637 domain-containing protein [Vibrio alginolyticus]
MKDKEIKVNLPPPLWQKCTSYLLSFVMVGQIILPGVANAMEVINDATITANVNASPQFSRVYNRERQFEKAYYIASNKVETAQDLVSFHKTLLNDNKSGLPEPLMIPIAVGDITVIFPHYPVDKRIGDKFVQARLIRMQMQREIDRLILPKMSIYQSGSKDIDPRTEKEQINYLYQNAKSFAAKYSVKYGEKVTRQQVNAFKHDFIWPELRSINGEQVLVPVLHLTDATINDARPGGHTVEVAGDYANFRNITVNSGTLLTRRSAFLNATANLSVGEHAKIIADEDLNLNVGGTLFNTGKLEASNGNVDIIAKQYGQKTMVHRYATKYEQGTRLGQIARVNADGTISITTSGDIKIHGSNMSANVIKLSAGGSIQIASQDTTYSRNEWVGGYNEKDSFVEHYGSTLEAKDSIFLMASGQVEIVASELIADEGVLSILASQGVHILNSFDQYQSSKSGKVGGTSLQESQFQSIAIRSALEAGKSVVIASEFGDINLKAVKLASQEGANISAHSGKVNLLLAKEQDHFFQQKVNKNFWRVKTTTIDRQNENAVYNSIVGGVNIQATKGLTLELAMKDNQTLDEVLDSFRKAPDLRWMAELYDDPEYRDNAELVYKKLVQVNKKNTSRALGPGPMAIIAIAVSIVMGPGGGLAITGGLTGPAAAAVTAMQVSIATSVISSVAAGNSLDGALESLTEKEYLRSLAIAAVTAGAMDYLQAEGFTFFDQGATNSNSWDSAVLAQQAGDVVIQSAVTSGIQTIINGGGSKDFFESWKTSAMHMATSKLGAKVANKIGSLTSEGRFNEAMRYVSHAALGCTLGVATNEINEADDRKGACTSGAVGAVVAEGTAAIYTEAMLTVQQKELRDALEELGLSYSPDLDSSEQLAAIQEKFEELSFNPSQKTLDAIRVITDSGVDVAKLTAGLTAMLAGLDVNIASSTGENAVENNYAWFFARLLARVVAVATLPIHLNEATDALIVTAIHYDSLDDAQKREFLENQLLEFATEQVAEAVVNRATRLLPIKALEEKLYIAIKSHPRSAAILAKVDKNNPFVQQTLIADTKKSQNAVYLANLQEKIETKKSYRLYLERNPGTSITYRDVVNARKNGKRLTENGRWANIDQSKIKLGDGDNYRRTASKENIADRIEGYDDSDFNDFAAKNPLTGENSSVGELTAERLKLVEAKRTVNVGAGGVHGERIENEYNAKIKKYSEAIGLARADHVAQNYCDGCTAKILKADYLDNSSNKQYDRIYEITRPNGTTEVLKIEAKGGQQPSYGTSQVGQSIEGSVISAQQGSIEYRNHIDKQMKEKYAYYENNYGELSTEQQAEFRRMTETKLSIELADKVTYIGVEQIIDKNSNNLKQSAISFFD